MSSWRRARPLPPALHHLSLGPIRSEYFDVAIDNGRAKLATARTYFNRNRRDPSLPLLSGDDVYLLNLREYAQSFWSRTDIDISKSCIMRIKISTCPKHQPNQAHNAATTLSLLNSLINRKTKTFKIFSIYYFKHSTDNYVYIDSIFIIPSHEFIDIIEEILERKNDIHLTFGSIHEIEINHITPTYQSLREETENLCNYTRGSVAERAGCVDAALQAHAITKVIGGIEVRGITPAHRSRQSGKTTSA